MAHRDFAGRTVVVTGAAGGLGNALCRRFGEAGASIAVLDSDAAGAASLSAELRALGIVAQEFACDVSDAQACAAAISQAVTRFGSLDVLINNAGITHRSAFAKTDAGVIRRVMEVNFFGAVNCTRAALAPLVASRGLIVVISSVAGFAPLIARTGYAASKHALHGFFDSLRTEVENDGVEVLVVCPSFIDTGIAKHALGANGLPAQHTQKVVGTRATPAAIAEKIFRAACRGDRLLLPGATALLSWWVSRLAPRLYARLMADRLRAEMHGTGER
jgi:NAD(P)-dependent dehydrogenase (short-subunit alcohol dehydrogenase family)